MGRFVTMPCDVTSTEDCRVPDARGLWVTVLLAGLAYVWGGRDLRAVAPRSDSANFPGFFSILCSVFRDSVVTIFRVISWNSPDF